MRDHSDDGGGVLSRLGDLIRKAAGRVRAALGSRRGPASGGFGAESELVADLKRRQEELHGRLGRCPVVDVLGVVDAGGVTGGKLQGETLWTATFRLQPWKHPGGALRNRPLTLRQQVADIGPVERRVKPYDVVHLRARVAEDEVSDSPQGLLVEIVGRHAADDELNRCARELQEPVAFHDERFGTFTLDRRVNWYEAETAWAGTRVRLNLSMDGCDDPDQPLAVARSLWDAQDAWSRRVIDHAVAELLGVKNEGWLDEDEAELSPEEFARRMTLESVTVSSDGGFEFWFDDGDLFAGHSILVSGTLADGPTNADFHG